MGMGLGLCCCEQLESGCAQEFTLNDSVNAPLATQGDLVHIGVDLGSSFGPVPWVITEALLIGSNGFWERPGIAVADDGVEVELVAFIRDVGNDCQHCLSPQELTIRWPSDPNDLNSPKIERTYEWQFEIDPDPDDCGLGYWVGPGNCPAGMAIAYGMRLWRADEMINVRFRVNINGISGPPGRCNAFNGAYILTPDFGPPTQTIDGWVAEPENGSFFYTWSTVRNIGPEQTAFLQFFLTPSFKEVGICPEEISFPTGTLEIPFAAGLYIELDDTTPGEEGTEAAYYYPIDDVGDPNVSQITKTDPLDTDWSDIQFGASEFFLFPLVCDTVDFANVTITEI